MSLLPRHPIARGKHHGIRQIQPRQVHGSLCQADSRRMLLQAARLLLPAQRSGTLRAQKPLITGFRHLARRLHLLILLPRHGIFRQKVPVTHLLPAGIVQLYP